MNNIALYENADKPEAAKFAEAAAKILINLGSDVFVLKRLSDQFDKDISSKVKQIELNEFEKFADAVISFGGDGTMLSAARSLIDTNIPIMGFNVGKLGFLAEYSVDKIDESLQNLIEGNFRIVDRFVLESDIDGEKLYALNDFVIEKKNSSRMITISTYTNDHLIADYRADGLIITTPTGSTAYSLSCNGPIISPSTKVICLTPISPHTLNLRPIVIPDTNEIKCKTYSPTGEINFVADGQVIRIVKNSTDLVIKRSESMIKLIKPTNSSYYDLLRKKLLWATNTLDDCIENKNKDDK